MRSVRMCDFGVGRRLGQAPALSVPGAECSIGRSSAARARALLAATLLAGAAAALASGSAHAQGVPPLDPASLSPTVDNPLFPASKLRFTRSTGSERDED